jgi:hypothetical protein
VRALGRRISETLRVAVDCLAMNIVGSGASGRETIVTLVACALLGFEVVSNLLFSFSVLFGFGLTLSSSIYSIIGSTILVSLAGVVLVALLGVVLLRQGGVSVPSREESGASRGALVGAVVGLADGFLLGMPIVGSVGICVLVGLAVGRTFDRPSIHRTS